MPGGDGDGGQAPMRVTGPIKIYLKQGNSEKLTLQPKRLS